MTTNLSTEAILRGMARALPQHDQADDDNDLTTSYEAIALLFYSYMASLDFTLQGLDPDQPSPECQSLAPRIPKAWNKVFNSFTFIYSHPKSPKNISLRIGRAGSNAEVRGMALGDRQTYGFECPARDVVRSAGLPVRNLSEDGDAAVGKLQALFVSQNAIADALRDLKTCVIDKLVPDLEGQVSVSSLQEGKEAMAEDTPSARRAGPDDAEAEANARQERRTQEARNPDAPFRGDANPNLPYEPNPLPDLARPRPVPQGELPPPGFEDEHQLRRPPPDLTMPGGRSPYNIGHDDLNPPGLGPHDPLRGSFIGGGLPQPGGGSGMYPTFDDPLFQGQGRGQGGYDPQAPPGARWDPLGPGGNPRFPGPGGSPFGGFGGGGFL